MTHWWQLLLAAAVAVAAIWLVIRFMPRLPRPTETVAIDKVIARVQEGIARAQAALGQAALPALDEVVLTLETTFETAADGEVKLGVLTLGSKVSKTASQSVEITLVPKPAAQIATAADARALADELAAAIIESARGVAAASAHPDVPLKLDNLEIELRFVVAAEATGKVEISVVDASLGAEIAATSAHGIKVVFKAPAP